MRKGFRKKDTLLLDKQPHIFCSLCMVVLFLLRILRFYGVFYLVKGKKKVAA